MVDMKIKHSVVVTRIIWGLFFWSVMSVVALADNVRPVYLEVEEVSSGKIRVVWKVPLGQGIPQDLTPSFPEQFRIVPPQKRVKINDAIIKTWEMIGPDGGLAGAKISIDGLKQTTTDGLVRVRLVDGSIHRVVLRPTETSTTIPDPHKAIGSRQVSPAALLQFMDQWRYVLLFSAAFGLSLVPGARRRGILLCTLALVAGALGGHALGRWSVYEKVMPKSMPTEAETARILQGLMLNTYRAFMLQKDEDVYDTLARSVAGEFLNEVYLQNREKLRLRGTDGALAVIHQLDIKSIDSMARKKDGRIGIVANWDVYGSVYHQNHVHYRCNTYTAEVVIEPSQNYWKLVRIDLLDEQRVL